MKLSYSSSQLETPTLTSQRYFSSLISNQHNSISDFIPSRRGFRKAHLNINSLTKHIDELRILLFDYSIDIISINETKLDDTIKSCEVHIPGYEFIRRDRNRQGGGVGFCIKTSINFVQSNPAISNSVNSKSPLFRRKIEFPWIYPYVFSHLLSAISNSVISNSPLFRTHRSFPTP